jgi:predicted Zn-dependent peptidase
MWDEVDKIKANGCNDEDLLKVKETALRERETYLKENRFWMQAINNSALDNENILELNDYTNYINGLKSDDFKRLANQYLTKENVATFTLMPMK